jgi:hypothetical protein
VNKIGLTSVWAKPSLAQANQDNQAEAAAEDAHALEDVIAARQRLAATRRSRRSRVLRFLHLGR